MTSILRGNASRTCYHVGLNHTAVPTTTSANTPSSCWTVEMFIPINAWAPQLVRSR
jgi:hypothetical protein